MYKRQECTTNVTLFNKNSVFEVNDPNSCLFFGNQNLVYKWAYNQSEIPSTPFITLPDGEVVKCMNPVSYTHLCSERYCTRYFL